MGTIMVPQAAMTNLVDLAKDHSRNGRMRLAETLADTFLNSGQMLDEQHGMMLSTFIEELLTGAGAGTIEARRIFADRAAKTISLPRQFAVRLAQDDISVARPILRHSPVLADEDLLSVIGMDSLPHQIVIAGRQMISQAVADALVTTNNPEVIGILLENFGAQMSRESMEKCTELAQQVSQLRLPLIERPEFTGNDATKLMWWLPRELRETVATRFGFAGDQTKTSTQPLVEQMLLRFRDQEPTEKEAESVAEWLVERNAINPQLLVQVLRLRSGPLFVALLAKLLKMPLAITRECFEEKTGQLLAVMCRAIGMEKAYFASTFMLSFSNKHSGKAMQPKVLDSALGAFDRVTQVRAQTMIKAWRDNPALLKSRI